MSWFVSREIYFSFRHSHISDLNLLGGLFKLSPLHSSRTNSNFLSFRHGEKVPYGGPRTADGIVDWVNQNAVKEPLAVADCAALEAKTAAASVAMTYFGAAEGGLWDTFTKAVNNQFITDKYEFFHTTDEDCASKYGVTAPGIAVTRIFDESPYAYTGAVK